MDQQTPGWMIGLIIFFAIGCATAFGFFVYNHSAASAVYEEWVLKESERKRLAQEKAYLEKLDLSLAEPRLTRLAKLEDIKVKYDEEKSAVDELLLPNHVIAVAEIKENTQKQLDTLRRLLAEADKAQDDLQTEEDNTLRLERQADEERLELRAEVQEQSQVLERLKKKQREDLLALEAEIAKRQKRVDELLDRIDNANQELRSDGQLLQARATSGFVIINRGRVHNLQKGTTFDVYNRRGGKNLIKGRIEVQRIEQNIAVCRVLSEIDPNDPLVPGDHIHNLIYNPYEQKIFVIAGYFDRFSREELAKFIEEAGGKVEDELSTRTHYLVAGNDSNKALEQAGLLGVTILSEDGLLNFVHSPFSFNITQGMTFVLAGDFTQVDARIVRSFITASGGIIETDVRDGLHVLVAGENAADAISSARVAGARIVTQDQLRHLVGSGRR